MDLTVATPPEVDAKLAEIWEATSKAVSYKQAAKLSLAYTLGIRPEYVTRTRQEVRESIETLIEMADAKIATGTMLPFHEDDLKKAVAKIGQYDEQIASLRAEAKPMEDHFAAKPWSRFFLVNNHGGHIHSSMSCSTCFPSTLFGWLPELSGLTEKDAVDAHGPLLCSICFPTAPVEWTLGKQPEADPNQCSGSGTFDYDQATYRRFYTGNGSATCTHCEQRAVGVTTSGKLRKHKKAKVKA